MQQKDGTISARALVTQALASAQPIAKKLHANQPLELEDQKRLAASYLTLLSVVDVLVAHVNAGDVRVPKNWPGTRP